MDAIHGILAYVAVAAVAAGFGWSAVLAVTGRTGGPDFERFQAARPGLYLAMPAYGHHVFRLG